ncbi:hypothetical protein D3C76_1734890 [compost metagenome]
MTVVNLVVTRLRAIDQRLFVAAQPKVLGNCTPLLVVFLQHYRRTNQQWLGYVPKTRDSALINQT